MLEYKTNQIVHGKSFSMGGRDLLFEGDVTGADRLRVGAWAVRIIVPSKSFKL
jgi:hypothetical protein